MFELFYFYGWQCVLFLMVTIGVAYQIGHFKGYTDSIEEAITSAVEQYPIVNFVVDEVKDGLVFSNMANGKYIASVKTLEEFIEKIKNEKTFGEKIILINKRSEV